MDTRDKMNSFVSGLIERTEKSLNSMLDSCKEDYQRLETLKAYMEIVETLASVTDQPVRKGA